LYHKPEKIVGFRFKKGLPRGEEKPFRTRGLIGIMRWPLKNATQGDEGIRHTIYVRHPLPDVTNERVSSDSLKRYET